MRQHNALEKCSPRTGPRAELLSRLAIFPAQIALSNQPRDTPVDFSCAGTPGTRQRRSRDGGKYPQPGQAGIIEVDSYEGTFGEKAIRLTGFTHSLFVVREEQVRERVLEALKNERLRCAVWGSSRSLFTEPISKTSSPRQGIRTRSGLGSLVGWEQKASDILVSSRSNSDIKERLMVRLTRLRANGKLGRQAGRGYTADRRKFQGGLERVIGL
jgi:hypothetical protein